MSSAGRIARRVKAKRSGAGGRETDAGLAFTCQLGVEGARLVALREIASIILDTHRFGVGEARKHDAAELARVARAIGVERPAPLPAVDPHRELARLRNRSFDGGEPRIRFARHQFDTGRFDPHQRLGHGLFGAR